MDDSKTLHACLETYSQIVFQRKLRGLNTPIFEIGEGDHYLALWIPDKRLIRMSRSFLLRAPWWVVEGVISHEMAHQWVDEVMSVRQPERKQEGPHGLAFRHACERVGVMKVFRSGQWNGKEVLADFVDRNSVTDPMVEKIHKLLALSTSSNEFEAKLAMEKAQAWMQKYQIENIGSPEAETPEAYESYWILSNSSRFDALEQKIFQILVSYFSIRVIYLKHFDVVSGKSLRAVEWIGTKSQLQIAGHVRNFLKLEMNKHPQSGRFVDGVDRKSYRLGILYGFEETLQKKEASRDEDPEWEEAEEKALVEIEKRLEEAVTLRFPRIATTKVTRGGKVRRGTFDRGKVTGKALQYRPGLNSSGLQKWLLLS